MEAVVEPLGDHASIDSVKLNEVGDKSSSVEEDVCHKSNGVAESVKVAPDSSATDNAEAHIENIDADAGVQVIEDTSQIVSTSETESIATEHSNVDMVTEVVPAESTEIEDAIVSEFTENVNNTLVVDTTDSESKNCHFNDVQMEEVVESGIIETTNDNVRFETEILVETNDTDITEIEIQDSKADNQSPNNILSEIGQNIELSEVLRSSDVTENVENNNCPIRQEVFNKEELLDILEGNDDQPTSNQVVDILHNTSMLEAQLALEQISRLKNNRKVRASESFKHKASEPQKSRELQKSTEPQKSREHQKTTEPQKPREQQKSTELQKPREQQKTTELQKSRDIKKNNPNKDENIVNALVKDWDDDEHDSEDQPPKEKESSKSAQHVEFIEMKDENTVDSSTGDGQTPDLSKSDDGQPQRRLGRVIKKKVIFDPDNPDTFTKSKTVKNKEPEIEKDQHQPKKAKLEQTALRAKSKSPVSKMQWKKPPPKNSKQNKRLTEVDKLLMDEGAVNMIYQLTPEAPKGKKNMKTKAEFIKKLQSSTPDGKEMKFRERKKESIKIEEGEARKILGGKQRSSLSSSVKSPSVSEDFETHSADDSIIYRRHSSSSYSSSCMSPRRLSDVDTSQSVNSSQPPKEDAAEHISGLEPITDVFQPDSSVSNEIINKDDCLSIKKKLNSKLSLALNKRKRESGKTDKPIKKRVSKSDGISEKGDVDNFKYLSVAFDQRVAEICIRKSGSKYNIEVLKEMHEALSYIDSRDDVSLTLLMSECGGLCTDLDLTSLLDNDVEKRTKSALKIAESVRLLMSSAQRHSKVLCCGVWGRCAGLAPALLALSDVALAGELAVFALRDPPALALAALQASARNLSPNVVKELVIFGRELSASEALRSGLIDRVLWPSAVADHIQSIVKDIAAKPPQGLLLKKKLLKLGQNPESTFLSQLESEASLVVEYWTSDEGQETLRANIDIV